VQIAFRSDGFSRFGMERYQNGGHGVGWVSSPGKWVKREIVEWLFSTGWTGLTGCGRSDFDVWGLGGTFLRTCVPNSIPVITAGVCPGALYPNEVRVRIRLIQWSV